MVKHFDPSSLIQNNALATEYNNTLNKKDLPIHINLATFNKRLKSRAVSITPVAIEDLQLGSIRKNLNLKSQTRALVPTVKFASDGMAPVFIVISSHAILQTGIAQLIIYLNF